MLPYRLRKKKAKNLTMILILVVTRVTLEFTSETKKKSESKLIRTTSFRHPFFKRRLPKTSRSERSRNSKRQR